MSVLLFNLFGYRLVISSLQASSEATIEHRVDRFEYHPDELIVVKTPLSLAYYSTSTSFERAYGSISIEGREYEYVKRRVHQDTLELLCLPNHTKSGLKEVGNEMAKAAADAQTPSQKKGFKMGTLEYIAIINTFQFAVREQASTSHALFNTRVTNLLNAQRQDRPPQQA